LLFPFIFRLEQFQLIIQKSQKLSIGHLDQGSHSLPSLLHEGKGLATTIQFQPGIIGLTHIGIDDHARIAGHPKHIAVHIHHVRVGVTNILTKFVGEFVHKYQPAHNCQPQVPHGKLKGEAGQTVGIGAQYAHDIHVRAEKIGNHSHTFNQSQIG
jgi:hypothetical protein